MPSGKIAVRRSRIITLRGEIPAPRKAAPVRRTKREPQSEPPARKVARPASPSAHKAVLSAPRNALPGWHDLATGEGERHRQRSRNASFLEAISTTRFGFVILAIAIGFTAYVGHVHATRNLLVEVQNIQRENLRLHLQYNRLKGEFDRATGPTLIYRHARQLGLQEAIAYGPTIRIGTP